MDHAAIVMWALVSAPIAGLLWICGHRLAAVRRARHEEYLLRRAKEYGKSYALAVWLERGDLVVDEMPGEPFEESLERRQFQHSWEADAYLTEFVETLRPRVVALARADAKAHSYRVAFSNGVECERNERVFTNSELASAYEEAYQAELRRRRGGALITPDTADQLHAAALSSFASGGFVGGSYPSGLEVAGGPIIPFRNPEVVQVSAVPSPAALEALRGSGMAEILRTVVRESVDRIVEEVELTTRFRVLEEQAPGDDVAVEALVCPAHLTIQDNVPWVSCGHHVLPGGQVPPHLPEELRRIYWRNVAEQKKLNESPPATRPHRRLRRRPGDA